MCAAWVAAATDVWEQCWVCQWTRWVCICWWRHPSATSRLLYLFIITAPHISSYLCRSQLYSLLNFWCCLLFLNCSLHFSSNNNILIQHLYSAMESDSSVRRWNPMMLTGVCRHLVNDGEVIVLDWWLLITAVEVKSLQALSDQLSAFDEALHQLAGNMFAVCDETQLYSQRCIHTGQNLQLSNGTVTASSTEMKSCSLCGPAAL